MTHSSPPGPVMFDLSGLSLTAEESLRLRHSAAGGIILFSRNYQGAEQLRCLVTSIRAIRPEILIAVDHEGGRVQRFRDGFTRIPPAACYRRCGARAPELAEAAGWIMAAELRSFDIDFSFAPVLDVDGKLGTVIGDRSFADQPADVSELAEAYHRGMHRAGMAGVGKHFPGHGTVAEDSHLELPLDGRTWDEIDCRDLIPFRSLIDSGLEGIMPAHVLYPNCDEHAAGYSPFWIGEVLRRRLGFQGVVFSDDLSMGGAACAGDYSARALAALYAGCDMVLVCNAPEQVDTVLECVQVRHDPAISDRLEAMRGEFPVERDALLRSAEWRDASGLMARLSEARP